MRLLIPFLVLLGLCPVVADGRTFTAEVDRTVPLAAGGEIVLDNVNGSVAISTWDKAEVRIVAHKEAPSEEDLKALEIRIDAKPDRVSIETEYLKKDGSWLKKFTNRGEVRYTLTVPREAHLREIETVNGSIEVTGVHGRVNASSTNGRIVARGLRHEVSLETTNGSISADFEAVTEKQDIQLETVNGSIELTIPAETGADVKAETVNGRISNEFGLQSDKSGWIGRELQGRIGTGAARIRLETVNGAISLKKRVPLTLER